MTEVPRIDLPVEVTRVVDGDTVEVEIKITAKVRLLELYAPESNEDGGPEATEHLRHLAENRNGWLTIPIKDGNGLSNLFSFGRILGYIRINEYDLSSLQRLAGHGTRKKEKK